MVTTISEETVEILELDDGTLGIFCAITKNELSTKNEYQLSKIYTTNILANMFVDIINTFKCGNAPTMNIGDYTDLFSLLHYMTNHHKKNAPDELPINFEDLYAEVYDAHETRDTIIDRFYNDYRFRNCRLIID